MRIVTQAQGEDKALLRVPHVLLVPVVAKICTESSHVLISSLAMHVIFKHRRRMTVMQTLGPPGGTALSCLLPQLPAVCGLRLMTCFQSQFIIRRGHTRRPQSRYEG